MVLLFNMGDEGLEEEIGSGNPLISYDTNHNINIIQSMAMATPNEDAGYGGGALPMSLPLPLPANPLPIVQGEQSKCGMEPEKRLDGPVDNGVAANLDVAFKIESQMNASVGVPLLPNQSREDPKNEHQSSSTRNMGALVVRDQELQQSLGLALWVKWRGKWQAGIHCSLDDCPSLTVKAMPTYGRKTYIVVYFPNSRTHCWTDSQLVCAITERPEPLSFGTHESGQELVKDLSSPRRFMLQKLAVSMLDAGDQLHVEAVVERARNVNAWKEFAKEAAQCTTYSDLGRMLLKLHSMILERYINPSWMKTFDLWKHRCENTGTAEYTEKLIEELENAILWDNVSKLWENPVQPGQSEEWKTWKREVMKVFSTTIPYTILASDKKVDKESREDYGRTDPLDTDNLEVSRKRQKLEVRRGISSETKDTNGSQFCAPAEVFYSPFVPNTGGYQIIPYTSDSNPMKEEEAGIGNHSITKIRASHGDRGYQQCSAFIEKKGRKCNLYAINGGLYCWKHLGFHTPDNVPRVDQVGSSSATMHADLKFSICQGMTKYGRRCTHRTRNGASFCLKHMLRDSHSLDSYDGTPSSSSLGSNPKRARVSVERQSSEKEATSADFHNKGSQDEQSFLPISDLERISGSVSQKLHDDSYPVERNRLHGSSLPERAASKVSYKSANWLRCIGSCRNHGGQCTHRAKQGSSYCEKHLPNSLGFRHRYPASMLNGIFKTTSFEETCQPKDLLHEYMNVCLSGGGNYDSDSENRGLDWIVEKVSKNMKDAEALLMEVKAEKEKMAAYFSFQEREGNVTASIPSIDDVHETDDAHKPLGSAAAVNNGTAKQSPLDGMEDCGAVHYSSSIEVQNQECKGCGEQFSDLQTLGHHCLTIHRKAVEHHFRGYACRNCSSSFTNKKGLERHVKVHHGGIPLEQCTEYLCISCGSRFIIMNCDQLLQHVLLTHPEQLNNSFGAKEQVNSAESTMPFKTEQDKQDEPLKLASSKQELSWEFDSKHKMERNHISMSLHGEDMGKGEARTFIRDTLKKFSCRFCGMKFSLLPDLGRHHQSTHLDSRSTFKPHLNRGNELFKPKWRVNKPNFRMSQTVVGYKHAAVIARKKRLKRFDLKRSMRVKNRSMQTEESGIHDRFTESYCTAVADMLLSEGQKIRSWPSNLEILTVARASCCRSNLHAALEEKYGALPEKLYVKAVKLCSEENIRVEWHRESYICPKGCKPKAESKPSILLTPLPELCFDSLTLQVNGLEGDAKKTDIKETWEKVETHLVLNSSDIEKSHRRKTIILLKDLSFGKEAVPIPCVVDEDVMNPCQCDLCKDGKDQNTSSMTPWENFSYVTERLLDPSLGLDTKSSQLGCTCTQPQCIAGACDHVYLFENDNENAEDIYGKPIHGRFPYDEKGRIILEKGFLVYECNNLCSCQKDCQNRVLQNGVQVKLEVFKTQHKGWAVRAAESISRGTFICEYNGEVLNDQEANKRGERYNKGGCSYLYDIDPHIATNEFMEETKPYVIDATNYGNVARFINHSCSPNLVNYQVLIESMDCQLAHIGLYASRDIAAGEELAYDYHYKLLPGNGSLCHCGAKNCRGRLY